MNSNRFNSQKNAHEKDENKKSMNNHQSEAGRHLRGTARSTLRNSRLKSLSHLTVVLFALGSMVMGLGQACSSGLGSDLSSAVATTEGSSISSGSNTSLAISPTLQTIAYNSTLAMSASGGIAPYTFFLASGGGSVNSASGVYSAPGSNATISVGVSDATGAKVYAVVMVANSASNITLSGTYSKVFNGSYAVLQGINGACSQAAPYGDGCNAAIHQYCANMGYATGFGPNEHDGDLAIVTCLIVGTTTLKTVPYIGYTGIIPSCNAGTALSDGCLAAQNRYCKSLGAASGFGPVNHDASNGTVQCVSTTAAVYQDIGLTTIQSQVSSCGEANAASPECMSGAFRYCRNQGYISGYGVVEHNTSNVGIFCTK